MIDPGRQYEAQRDDLFVLEPIPSPAWHFFYHRHPGATLKLVALGPPPLKLDNPVYLPNHIPLRNAMLRHEYLLTIQPRIVHAGTPWHGRAALPRVTAPSLS